MRPTEEQGQLEKERAEQIIAATPLMEGILSASVELGEDHSDDPAMWVFFRMAPELKPDDEWFDRFNRFSHRISMKIIHSGVERFQYTRLKQAA